MEICKSSHRLSEDERTRLYSELQREHGTSVTICQGLFAVYRVRYVCAILQGIYTWSLCASRAALSDREKTVLLSGVRHF